MLVGSCEMSKPDKTYGLHDEDAIGAYMPLMGHGDSLQADSSSRDACHGLGEQLPRGEHAGSSIVEARDIVRALDATTSGPRHETGQDLASQAGLLEDISAQAILRQVSVRTDAVTGQPISVYPAAPAPGGFHAPGTMLHAPDVDEAESKWRKAQPIVAFWMACSGISFLSSLFWLPLGCLSGFLGIVGAWLMCSCTPSFSFALAVKAQQTLASICMVLSGSIALVLLYVVVVIRCDESHHSSRYCFRLSSTLCLLVLWHCVHAAVSSVVSMHSSNIKRLLDPVKTGVILLPRARRVEQVTVGH